MPLASGTQYSFAAMIARQNYRARMVYEQALEKWAASGCKGHPPEEPDYIDVDGAEQDYLRRLMEANVGTLEEPISIGVSS